MYALGQSRSMLCIYMFVTVFNAFETNLIYFSRDKHNIRYIKLDKLVYKVFHILDRYEGTPHKMYTQVSLLI